MRLALACLVLCASVGGAAAAGLAPEDEVAFLLAGIRVGQTSEVAGITFQWQQSGPGAFSGHGTNDTGGTLDLTIDIKRVTDCTYDAATHVDMNGQGAYDATAHYDFTKITGMALLGASDAQITGTDFCTSDAEGICDPHIALASPTDHATFDGIYQDFRAGTCH